MRGLNEQFINDLNGGFLDPVRRAVIADRDLILAIRENAINIYYKGNSLLALAQEQDHYKTSFHAKFCVPEVGALGRLGNGTDVQAFISALPNIKQKILMLHRGGNEIEYEQMIIRSNNLEPKLNTDYLIIDRQLVTGDREGRYDLTGIYLPRRSWHRTKQVSLALLEVKFGLNPDIVKIHEQLGAYYKSVATRLDEIAEESEIILRQKVELGLLQQTSGRLRAFKQIRIIRDIRRVRFAIVLVDYAPASKLLPHDKLAALPFADQIDIFTLGFGLWQSNACPVLKERPKPTSYNEDFVERLLLPAEGLILLDKKGKRVDTLAGIPDLGPQYKHDSPFAKKMRLHQSWYRANVLKVPCGTGPGPNHKHRFGNMLTKEDGAKGLNFLTPEIFELAKKRIAEGKGMVDEYRLLHNMMSSMPMCFNLFGPMADDHDLATRVFQQILPGEVERVIDVRIEYAPEPRSEYLNDATAFDAYVEFIRPDGKKGFVGIETKLTEPFSQKVYDTPVYRKWTELPESPWPVESWPNVADVRWNQLWRDHLLAVAMRYHENSPYASGHLMLVHHPEDKECDETSQEYSKLLKSKSQMYIDFPLNMLADTIELGAPDERLKQLVREFRRRYLHLS